VFAQFLYHLSARTRAPQGLTGHDVLAELDVSYNHLTSEGAQHLARLIVTLPSLQQLHVAAIGMRADGLQALSMQVRLHGSVCVCVCLSLRHLGTRSSKNKAEMTGVADKRVSDHLRSYGHGGHHGL